MIAHATTPTQMALHAAKKARYARLMQMAAKVKANDNARLRVVMRLPDEAIEQAQAIMTLAYISAWYSWQLSRSMSGTAREWIANRCKEIGVDYKLVKKSSNRSRFISHSRQILIVEVREKFPNLTLKETGNLFGGMDHTSIIFAEKKIAEMRAQGKDPLEHRQMTRRDRETMRGLA